MDSLNDHWGYEDPLYDELADARLSMNIPALASTYLGFLAGDGGLPDVGDVPITLGGRALTRPIKEDPINTPSDLRTFPARLDNGQVIWVRVGERYSSGAPISVSVVDKPTTVGASVAALTLMEGGTVETQQLKKHLPLVDLSHPIGIRESAHETFKRLSDGGDRARAVEFLAQFPSKAVSYAVALLRYYRPGFDALPEDEKRELVVGCCERINKTIAATRQLTGFLEYGASNRDQRAAVENPHQDVEIAVLRDVKKESYPEIAARLKIEVSEKARCIGDFSRVGHMARRGRDILERAFGKDGWARRATDMRLELERSNTLSEREKFLEDLADDLRLSKQATQDLLKGENPAPTAWGAGGQPYIHLGTLRTFYKALSEEVRDVDF